MCLSAPINCACWTAIRRIFRAERWLIGTRFLGLWPPPLIKGAILFTKPFEFNNGLFTTKPITLGVEESLKNPETPCGLKTDAERARNVRRRVSQMLNSQGVWENYPTATDVPLKNIFATISSRESMENGASSNPPMPPALRPVLCESAAVEKVGSGSVCVVGQSEHGGDIRSQHDRCRHPQR